MHFLLLLLFYIQVYWKEMLFHFERENRGGVCVKMTESLLQV